MFEHRCSPDHPVAILSFHSHSDRSFLDDRELALLSGDLRHDGIKNDLVLTVMTAGQEQSPANAEIEDRLVAELRNYDPIVYERVWSPQLVERLRAQLPDKVFIGLRGEHELLDSAPADIYCNAEPRQILAPLIQWLRNSRTDPPAGTLFRDRTADSQKGTWQPPTTTAEVQPSDRTYAPNLRPLVVNPELLPKIRTFSVTGNIGCPFQNDARDNPLYEGTDIPQQFGRGCAFCTTGNVYEGKPNNETAAFVLEQIRHVRSTAPELQLLVLKDQNPFGYLTEVVERCAQEDLRDFALLLETRAEWFLRNSKRFERALEIANQINVRLAPFLVGIENFSQAELDRFNKGIKADLNVEFLETLWKWKEQHGDAFDLSHTAFGFILFSPWTTLQDLEINLAGIRRTKLDRLRGSLLLSRARLYPDTALYYLAKRDGLLVEDFASERDNASQRYGYYPSHPWKHVNADVAHFAELATEVAERNNSRDMVNLFDALLTEFQSRGEEWSAITAEDIWQRYSKQHGDRQSGGNGAALQPASEDFRARFARLIAPLALDQPFADGWTIAEIQTRPGQVRVHVQHPSEAKLVIELSPRGEAPRYRRSRHYDIRAQGSEFTASQSEGLRVLAESITTNDS